MKRLELLKFAYKGAEEELRSLKEEDYKDFEKYNDDVIELGNKIIEIIRMIEEEEMKQ